MTQRKMLLMMTGAAVLGLAVPGFQLADTKDQVSVDVELIIGVDVSYSMDIDELERLPLDMGHYSYPACRK